jgi:hypothetical protein
MAQGSFSRLCEPAKLYLVLSLIFLVFGVFTQMAAMTLIVKGFFILFWTLILNFLCSIGLKFISWILVLLPFLVLLLSVGTSMDMMAFGGGRREGFYMSGGAGMMMKKTN